MRLAVCAKAFRGSKSPEPTPNPKFSGKPGVAPESPRTSHWIHIQRHSKPRKLTYCPMPLLQLCILLVAFWAQAMSGTWQSQVDSQFCDLRFLPYKGDFLFHWVRRRTNEQQLTCKMVWSFFFFSFILFYCLWTKTAVKPLNSKKSPGGKLLKNSEKVWKSVEKCQKVWKSAETILPFSCCPFSFSLMSSPEFSRKFPANRVFPGIHASSHTRRDACFERATSLATIVQRTLATQQWLLKPSRWSCSGHRQLCSTSSVPLPFATKTLPTRKKKYFRIIFWLPFHDFDFFELILENYPIPIAFVWVVRHYPVGTPVLVELFFITVTRLGFFRINWVMFSWQMVHLNYC